MTPRCVLPELIVTEMQAAGVIPAGALIEARNGKVTVECSHALAAWCREQATRSGTAEPERAQVYMLAAESIETALSSAL